ncbi:MAG: MmgE/PrpD family protein [Lachnospiraceae bacterium]|nr:MmgE/PrpD family protein [Lachnospiraceae bacterium]MBR4768405.1 MmgE/PrpD family protein [Lachnospiraceae bacterium]
MSETKNYTDVFVNTLYSLSVREMPAEIMNEARKCLLDGMASMLGGSAAMKENVSRFLDLEPPCPDGVTVVSMDRKASLQSAALANALSLHCFDMDDGHRYSTVHLAASVIPAVLAIGEYYDLSLEDLLRGIVIGYETGIRMGQCIQPAHRNRGFHSTGTAGTLGAALSVAAALRFSREEMKAALSAAATSAGGLGEAFENISTLKPFNAGHACQDGITAALIAKAGFVGPYDMLSGKLSFLKAMCETCDPTVLDYDVDPEYHITGCYHKLYASCRHTHAAIDGAILIRRKHHPDPEDIEKVEIRMYAQGVNSHDHTEIPSVVAGKMSIPFSVALALVRENAGISAFTEETIRDEAVTKLCRKVTVQADPEMTALVPKKRPSSVTVYMKNGAVYEERVDYALGEPENPVTERELMQKYLDLSAYGGKTEAEARKIAEIILKGNGSVRDLTEKLR